MAKSIYFRSSLVKVISLDVTGTILNNSSVGKAYSDAALSTKFPLQLSVENINPAFKKSFAENNKKSPCYGAVEGISSREWWRRTVRETVTKASCQTFTEQDFERLFRRIYQHYGSKNGYEIIPKSVEFLAWVKSGLGLSVGVISNSPFRTIETVLPMLNMDKYFDWFICSQDVKVEKPNYAIFDAAYENAKFWIPNLKRHEILHIGDDVIADYCGAKAAGFQAILLNGNKNTLQLSLENSISWKDSNDYVDKSIPDVIASTVENLSEVRQILTITS